MAKNKKYSIRVRMWVDETNGPFLGIGRVWLLEHIGETGSITNASKKMKMSYRQAWQLVENMNEHAQEPLVEKLLGGKGGGGAKLTTAGQKAIKTFYALEKKINDFINKESGKIKF